MAYNYTYYAFNYDMVEEYNNTLTSTSFPASAPSLAIPTDFYNEMQLDSIQPFHLIKLELSAGSLLYTDAPVDIEYSSETYISNSLISSIPSFTEEAGFTNRSVKLQFNGADQTLTAVALNNFNANQKVYIYRAFFHEEETGEWTIVTPVLTFVGYLDSMSLSEGSDSKIDWEVVGVFSDYERIRGRSCNQTDSELYYPNDLTFRHAADIVTNLKWGRT